MIIMIITKLSGRCRQSPIVLDEEGQSLGTKDTLSIGPLDTQWSHVFINPVRYMLWDWVARGWLPSFCFFLLFRRGIRGRSWGLPIPWCSGTAVRISRDGLRLVSQWEQAEIMWKAREQRREAYEQKWSVVFVCPLALFFTPDCDLLCCFCSARSRNCQHIGIRFTAKCRAIDRSEWS